MPFAPPPDRLAWPDAARAAALRPSGLDATLAATDNEVPGGSPQAFARPIDDDRDTHRRRLAERR